MNATDSDPGFSSLKHIAHNLIRCWWKRAAFKSQHVRALFVLGLNDGIFLRGAGGGAAGCR